MVAAATQFWIDALGADDARLATLRHVDVQLGNLQPQMLGVMIGQDIYIDTDATRYG